MSIRENLSTISTSITNVIVAACGIDQSITNLVSAANHGTKALDIMALSFEEEIEAERVAKLKKLKKLTK